MAQGHGKKPDGKAVELPQERLARQKIEANLDSRTKEASRTLEKAQAGQEIDPELAAQLQKGLGNAALAGMVKQGSDTDTSTTGAEATLDEAREKDGEEEQEESEGGELEQILPSFSTGGGAPGGAGGNSPWAMGKFFGGDGDDEGDPTVLGGPRWRPLPVPPDPDEEIEVERVEPGESSEVEHEASLLAADHALGSAPWTPGALSRGLRHPARLVGRTCWRMDGESDPIWSRARAMLRFLAEHAPNETARHLAAGGAALGVAEATPLIVALARDLALLEAALGHLDQPWAALCDIAGDQRARPRAEHAAAILAQHGRLFAPDLLAAALGETVPAVPVELGGAAHSAAVAAVQSAARLGDLPAIHRWNPENDLGAPPTSEAERLVDALLGAEDPILILTDSLRPLYRQLNRLLACLGAIQVETAAAALAAWPWLADGIAEGVARELDLALRAAARRLVEVGRAIEEAAQRGDADEVSGLSSRLSGIAALAELTRLGAMQALAAPLLHAEAVRYEPAADARESLFVRGRTGELRAGLRDETLADLAWRVRLDGAGAIIGVAGRNPEERLLILAAGEAGLGPGSDVAEPQRAELPEGPYVQAYAAILAAQTDGLHSLFPIAARLREAGAGAVLNLVKAAFAELSAAAGGITFSPVPAIT